MFFTYRFLSWIPWLLIATAFITTIILIVKRPEKTPCDFFNSVNITDGVRQPNSSILHNGILYEKDEYVEVDYKKNWDNKFEAVDPHLRGCLCTENRPCIRMCKPIETIKSNRTDQQFADLMKHELHFGDNDTRTVQLDKHFVVLHGKYCSDLYGAENYIIKHTGQLEVKGTDKSVVIDNFGYCMNYDDDGSSFPGICFTDENNLHEWHPYIMLASVGFIAATVVVYVFLSELRNLHGKCLLCYMICLAVAFVTHYCANTVQISNTAECIAAAYIEYFAFLAAFLWSGVIGFDLWSNFWTTDRFLTSNGTKRFIFYMIFAWLVAILCVSVVAVIDNVDSIPFLKPDIANNTCFITDGKDHIVRLIYFYIPMCIVYIINMVFFILTAWKIYELKRELKNVMVEKESARKMKTKKDGFTLYLRLFIVMGISWIAEGFSVWDEEGKYSLFTDTINCMQGMFIFACFVLKEDVLRLMHKRFIQMFGKSTSNESFVTTSTYDGQAHRKSRLSRIPLHRIISREEKCDNSQVE